MRLALFGAFVSITMVFAAAGLAQTQPIDEVRCLLPEGCGPVLVDEAGCTTPGGCALVPDDELLCLLPEGCGAKCGQHRHNDWRGGHRAYYDGQEDHQQRGQCVPADQ